MVGPGGDLLPLPSGSHLPDGRPDQGCRPAGVHRPRGASHGAAVSTGDDRGNIPPLARTRRPPLSSALSLPVRPPCRSPTRRPKSWDVILRLATTRFPAAVGRTAPWSLPPWPRPPGESNPVITP